MPNAPSTSAERRLIRVLIAAILSAAMTVPAAPLIALAWLTLVKGVNVDSRLDHFWSETSFQFWAWLIAWNVAASIPLLFWGLIHYSFIGMRQPDVRRSMTLIIGGATLALGILYMIWFGVQTWIPMLDPGERVHSTAVLGLCMPAFMIVAPATCFASFVGFLIDVTRPSRPRRPSDQANRAP